MTWDGKERRTDAKLHDEDIDRIVEGVKESINTHFCRFDNITTDDMKEVVKFTLKFKGVAEKTGMWIFFTVITILTTGASALIALGLWRKSGGE